MPATTGVYPERSRRAPTRVWRGRPRPRKERFGWRSHFGNRFVGHVHSSLTRNSAATHSGIGDGGAGGPPHPVPVHPSFPPDLKPLSHAAFTPSEGPTRRV